MPVRALASTLVRGLSRRPDRVHVHERSVRGRLVIELSVHPDDRGRVIGREGRTARALRTLLGAVARRHDRSVQVEILD
jgi:predicted RNA-binding protein YlqC (UPF0109 family)